MRGRTTTHHCGKRLLLGYGIAAAVSFAACAALFSMPAVNVLEWRLVDFWMQKTPGKSVSQTVAVVGIDEAMLVRHGWPLEKDLYADLISFLLDMDAAVIAFDVVFADNLDACGKGDSLFTAMVELVPNLVFGYGATIRESHGNRVAGARGPVPQRFALAPGTVRQAEIKNAVLPYDPLLRSIHNLGFFNISRPFVDGVDRQMPLFMSQDSLIFPSLALQAVITARPGVSVRWNAEELFAVVGDRQVPADHAGRFFVNFSDSLPIYPMSVLEESHQAWLRGETPLYGREAFEGRVVFVGNTALSLGDFGVTPLSGRTLQGRSPNVLMHAYAAANLFDGQTILSYGRIGALIVSAVLIAVGAALFLKLPAQFALCCTVLLLPLVLFAAVRLFLAGMIVPVLEGACACVLFTITGSLVAYYGKDFDRRRLHSLFRNYLSPQIIDDMYQRGVKPELGGAEVYATAFFTDIEGFSSFSEELTPGKLLAVLNEYFSAMTAILLDCKGTLDKFVGDAMVAFFGAPGLSLTHAHDACDAAVRMQEKLRDLRNKWHDDPDIHQRVKHLKMRIGINTGNFITGNVGCDFRMNYTMMGDTVNLASRLESAAKNYGVYTVVGENTARNSTELFLLRRLDRIQVKGRAGAVDIYQLMGRRNDKDAPTLRLISSYEDALDDYCSMNFAAAAEKFRLSLAAERFPEEKNPSRVMLTRCERLMKNMPEVWDGVFRPDEK